MFHWEALIFYNFWSVYLSVSERNALKSFMSIDFSLSSCNSINFNFVCFKIMLLSKCDFVISYLLGVLVSSFTLKLFTLNSTV